MVRLLQRLPPVIPFAAAVNSLFLTSLFTRAFFSETGAKALVSDFMTPFFTIPIIIISLLLISNIRRKTYLPEKKHPGIFIFLTIPFYFLLLIFLGVFTGLLWHNLAATPAASVKVTVSLLAEITAITLAAGAQKKRRIGKVLGLLFAWSFSIIGAFTVLGIFEKRDPVVVPDELQLIFAGIFFHAANSVYLVYAGAHAYNLARKKRATTETNVIIATAKR